DGANDFAARSVCPLGHVGSHGRAHARTRRLVRVVRGTLAGRRDSLGGPRRGHRGRAWPRRPVLEHHFVETALLIAGPPRLNGAFSPLSRRAKCAIMSTCRKVARRTQTRRMRLTGRRPAPWRLPATKLATRRRMPKRRPPVGAVCSTLARPGARPG